jgi:hypothetical protein
MMFAYLQSRMLLTVYVIAATSTNMTYHDKCGNSQVAILAVGDSAPLHFDKHANAMITYIIRPLQAGVFAVTDSEGPIVWKGLPLREALPMAFGASLKALALMDSGSHAKTAVGHLSRAFEDEGTRFVILQDAPIDGRLRTCA